MAKKEIGLTTCTLIAVLFALLPYTSHTYTRGQFNLCLENNCWDEISHCDLEPECANLHLDFNSCTAASLECTSTVVEASYSGHILNCFNSCFQTSSNSDWSELEECYISCDARQLALSMILLLSLIMIAF